MGFTLKACKKHCFSNEKWEVVKGNLKTKKTKGVKFTEHLFDCAPTINHRERKGKVRHVEKDLRHFLCVSLFMKIEIEDVIIC